MLSSRKDSFFLFVYGTLKCGYDNHDGFCRGVLEIEDGAVHGDLYDLPFGFPALIVPEETIHAEGSRDPVLDADVQHHLNSSDPVELRDSVPRVFGELLAFDDPRDRLPRLDHLEGFDPEGRSLYRRVLIPVETATRKIMAWAYAIEKPTGTHLPGGRWPS